jgi:hypothetical protein
LDRKLGIVIASFIVLLMTLTVMITGNHYWLDAVGGWAVIGVAYIINRHVPYPFLKHLPWRKTAPDSARGAAV